MRRKAALKAAVVGLLAAVTLSGCTTVSVRAQVIDDSNASFAIQKVVTKEGYVDYLNYLRDLNENQEPQEELFDLSGLWEQNPIPEGAPFTLELRITSESVEIYRVTSEGQELNWQGTYIPPTESGSSFSWVSTKVDNPALESDGRDLTEAYLFDYNGSVLSFVPQDGREGAPPSPTFFQRADSASDTAATAPEEETTTEEQTSQPIAGEVSFTDEDLCKSFTQNVGIFDPVVAGVEPEIECTEVDFAVTTVYNVEYDFSGVTTVNGVAVNSTERNNLPFRFYPDQEFGDIVFEHRIVGLLEGQFPSTNSWLETITDYNVTVFFPGGVNDFNGEASGAVSDGFTVTWNYDTIKVAVENNVFTLRAAGDPNSVIDPMPYILTLVGFFFVLSILLYFSWKRLPAKLIAVVSLLLLPVSPFGIGMAIIAQKKAAKDAPVKRLATVSLVLNGAAFTFIVLVTVLTFLLAPQIVEDVRAIFGW